MNVSVVSLYVSPGPMKTIGMIVPDGVCVYGFSFSRRNE